MQKTSACLQPKTIPLPVCAIHGIRPGYCTPMSWLTKKSLPADLPEGTLVRTPLSKAVVYSSVHCGLLNQIGALKSIGGVCDLKYIKLQEVQDGCRTGSITDVGNGMNPDIEKIIDLHPDAIMLSPFENSGGYGRVEKLNIPIIECADYMETSALGRAEWMRFYGLLFGEAQKADSLFAEVEKNYNELKALVAPLSSAPSVISELKNGSAWYVPGGKSTSARIYADAGANYVFANDEHSGSVPLAFETVFDKGQNADFWLIKYNQAIDKTYKELEQDYAPYTGFRAFKERNIYGCNTEGRLLRRFPFPSRPVAERFDKNIPSYAFRRV